MGRKSGYLTFDMLVCVDKERRYWRVPGQYGQEERGEGWPRPLSRHGRKSGTTASLTTIDFYHLPTFCPFDIFSISIFKLLIFFYNKLFYVFV